MIKKSTKDEMLNDFLVIINQIDDKSSDEIELGLQKIIHKIRPLIHRI